MRRMLLTAALAAAVPALARAQVGHAPTSSPYHDLFKGSTITFLGGRFGGGGGSVGVGPQNGHTFGLRFGFHATRPLELALAVSKANLERLLIDPTMPSAARVTGPVDQPVVFVEADIELNLTGGKTWHGVAPFVGAATGIGFGEGIAADTSGYNFRRKFFLAPNAGVRIFVTDRLHIRGEARAVFWKLSYPNSFRVRPNPVLLDGRLNEWDLSPWLLVGLGYTL